jgi:hypothetical protein
VNGKADGGRLQTIKRQRGGRTLDNPDNFFDIGAASPSNKIWDSFSIRVAGLITKMEYHFTMEVAGVIIKLRIPLE